MRLMLPVLLLGLVLSGVPAVGAGASPPARTLVAEAALSFQLPEGVNEQPVPGATDSLVRQYASSTLKILLDYGPYSDPLKEPVEGAVEYRAQTELIGGKSARVVTYRKLSGVGGEGPAYSYFSGIYFADLGRGRAHRLGLYASAQRPEDQARALEVMRSIRFD